MSTDAAVALPIDTSRAEGISGWMHRHELRWLGTQARQSKIVIEVGAWLGRSTRMLGEHVQGTVFSVDPWNGYVNDDGTIADWMLRSVKSWDRAYATFCANVADLMESGRVVPVRKPSTAALPSLYARLKGARADLAFIDGDHRLEAVRADISTYRKLVAAGGILAGHDYGQPDWPGVKAAVDEAFPSGLQTCRTIWWVTL